MGAIIGRFRKKKTTLQQLEELDNDIKCIEKYRFHTQQTEKKIIGQFILISTCIYILAVISYYYVFFPTRWNEQIFYITPLLLIPIVIWLVKRILKWYYRRKISKNEVKLTNLKTEKKKLLEQVMDTETYKIAKTILEKFAPDNLRKTPSSDLGSPLPLSLSHSPGNSSLRQRNMIMPKTPMGSKTFTIKGPSQLTSQVISSPAPSTNGQRIKLTATSAMSPGGMVQSLPMVRNIIPRDRSMLDKMVEYLVGDGPSNRYALICRNCQSHNGMALREEFEYIAFRCCYCFTYNPSRKLRLAAPRLEEDITPIRRLSSDKSSSDSEKNSDSEPESDREHHNSKPSSKPSSKASSKVSSKASSRASSRASSKASSKHASDTEITPMETEPINEPVIIKDND